MSRSSKPPLPSASTAATDDLPDTELERSHGAVDSSPFDKPLFSIAADIDSSNQSYFAETFSNEKIVAFPSDCSSVSSRPFSSASRDSGFSSIVTAPSSDGRTSVGRLTMKWTREVGTGPFAPPFPRSLAPLTHLLALHCSLRSRAPLRSFTRSLRSSWERSFCR